MNCPRCDYILERESTPQAEDRPADVLFCPNCFWQEGDDPAVDEIMREFIRDIDPGDEDGQGRP